MTLPKSICILIGTRPNFMKVAGLYKLLKADAAFEVSLVHTAQHYDENMSRVFLRQFELSPDVVLDPPEASQSPAHRLGSLISRVGNYLEEARPDVVMVAGDVDSTLAGFLAAKKSGIKVAHIESGLRSGDLEMPEEFNRILVDTLSDLLFVTEESGTHNLEHEQCRGRIFEVGNTMIDSIELFRSKIDASGIVGELGLEGKSFLLCTFHRPSNVNNPEKLRVLYELLQELSAAYTVVFPIHPRTIAQMQQAGMDTDSTERLLFTEPLSYFDFQKLIVSSKGVVTDSGGIQEESSYYGVPCFTIRENTERPITLGLGTNKLLRLNEKTAAHILTALSNSGGTVKTHIPLWDGKASERILTILKQEL